MPTPFASTLLSLATAANVVSLLGHTQMGYKEHFPPLQALGPRSVSAEVMRTGWLAVNVTYAMLGMYYIFIVGFHYCLKSSGVGWVMGL
jgi:hypothetical protein